MSKKLPSILIITSITLFLVLLASYVQAAGEIIINNFDLNPRTIANNTGSTQFQMTFRATIDLNKFNSKCGSNESSFYWYVYQDVTGVDFKRASGEQKFDRTLANISVNFDQTITVDTSDPALVKGGTAKYYGQVNCPSVASIQVARSAPSISVTFGTATNKSYACVASNNKYACSPANLSNCSDVSASAGCPSSSKPCIQIGKNLCGEDAGGGGGGACGNNVCDAGENPTNCSQDCKPNVCGNNVCESAVGEKYETCPKDCTKPGEDQTFVFKLENPLEADNFIELIDVLATWLFSLAIPVVVVMIVYAGVMFLTSRGEPAKITKAREILLYAVVGFAIILIGKGFITLIESILNLGASP